MNHTVVFQFVKHAVDRGLVDLIGQRVEQHPDREWVARLAKHTKYLFEVFGFSHNSHGSKLMQLGCNKVLHP